MCVFKKSSFCFSHKFIFSSSAFFFKFKLKTKFITKTFSHILIYLVLLIYDSISSYTRFACLIIRLKWVRLWRQVNKQAGRQVTKYYTAKPQKKVIIKIKIFLHIFKLCKETGNNFLSAAIHFFLLFLFLSLSFIHSLTRILYWDIGINLNFFGCFWYCEYMND